MSFNKRHILGFCFILLIFAVFPTYAFKFQTKHYTEEDGLASSTVSDIAQDSSGAIWFATRNGISYYDSKTWKHFSTKDGLPINRTVQIDVGKDGTVWALTAFNELKISYFDGKTWITLPYEIPQKEHFTLVNNYRLLALEKDGMPYIVISMLDEGLFVYHNDSLRKFDTTNGLNSNIINTIYLYKGKIYIGTAKGISIFDGENFDNSINDKINFPSKEILAISSSNNNTGVETLWVLGSNFLGYIINDYLNLQISRLNLSTDKHRLLYALEPNFHHSVVFGNAFHTYLFNRHTKTLVQLSKEQGLIDIGIFAILVDRENILWLTSERGVSKIPSMRFISMDERSGLASNEVTAIIEQSPGRYIIGHNEAITIYDKGNTKKHFFYLEYQISSRISNFAKDKNNNVWFSARKLGLGYIKPDGSFTIFSAEQLGVVNVGAVVVDSNQRVIFSDYDHIYEFVNFKPRIIDIPKKIKGFKRNLYVCPAGDLYLTTIRDGIYRFDGEYWYNYQTSNPETNNSYTVCKCLNGRIFSGHLDGLYIVSGDSLRKFKHNNFEISRPVYFILQDKVFPNTLWFGTDAGIIRWDGHTTFSYGVREGLAGLETNRGAGYIDSQNFLWIGTNKGVSRYNHRFDLRQVEPPIIRITRIEVNEAPIEKQDEVILKSKENFIQFYFDAISFIDESRNIVLYKLEGFDTQWNEVNSLSSNSIKYFNLASGKYRLLIKAKNSLGIESDVIYSNWFIIKSPFYYSFWFIAFVLAFTSVIFYFFIKYNTEQKYRKLLEKQVFERTEKLELSERRYKQMFTENNAIMLIIEMDSGQIIDANPSAVEFLDIPYNSLIGQPIYSICTFIDNPDYEHIKNNMQNNIDFEAQFQPPEKDRKFLKFHSSELFFENKKVFFIIIDDISVQKHAEQAAKLFSEKLELRVEQRTKDLQKTLDLLQNEIEQRIEAEKQVQTAKNELEIAYNKEKELSKIKSQFISMISHEYRTPLTVINTSSELIKECMKLGKHDEINKFVNMINNSVKIMTNLIEGVLNLNESTLPQIKLEKFNLISFINAIIEETQLIDKNQHNIIFNFSSDMSEIENDKKLLYLIIMNLLTNACKYSDENSDIILNLDLNATELILSVEDKGKGIKKENYKYLFEPFYRGNDYIGLVPGTGLGLSIVKRSVLALQGTVSIESEYKLGTKFIITLPLIFEFKANS